MGGMSIRSQKDFEKLRAIGRIVRETLDRTARAVRAGVTTRELDEIGARVLAEHGAESAPPKVYGFPGALCISVNDEAIHGIPGDRVIREGDLVKLDLVAEKDGYFADAAVTLTAGTAGAIEAALIRCAETAFELACMVARAGNRVCEIGRAVEAETQAKRLQCDARVVRPRSGSDDSRIAKRTEFSRPAIQGEAHGRACHHHRAYFGSGSWARRITGRQVDHPNRRPFPGRALRTHHRNHTQGAPILLTA